MSLPSSGAIRMSQIKTELGSSSNSLRNYSAAAGKSAPDAMSEFYGYGPCDSYSFTNDDQNYDREYSYTDCAGNYQSGTLGPERSMTFCARQGTVYTQGGILENNGPC